MPAPGSSMGLKYKIKYFVGTLRWLPVTLNVCRQLTRVAISFSGTHFKAQLAIPCRRPCQIIASLINIAENPIFMRSASIWIIASEETLGAKSSSINSLPSGEFRTTHFWRWFKTFSTALLCWITGLSELHHSFKVFLKRFEKDLGCNLCNDITIKTESLVHLLESIFIADTAIECLSSKTKYNSKFHTVLHMQCSSLSLHGTKMFKQTVVLDILTCCTQQK